MPPKLEVTAIRFEAKCARPGFVSAIFELEHTETPEELHERVKKHYSYGEGWSFQFAPDLFPAVKFDQPFTELPHFEVGQTYPLEISEFARAKVMRRGGGFDIATFQVALDSDMDALVKRIETKFKKLGVLALKHAVGEHITYWTAGCDKASTFYEAEFGPGEEMEMLAETAIEVIVEIRDPSKGIRTPGTAPAELTESYQLLEPALPKLNDDLKISEFEAELLKHPMFEKFQRTTKFRVGFPPHATSKEEHPCAHESDQLFMFMQTPESVRLKVSLV